MKNPTTSHDQPTHWVYLIECSNASFYTGYTRDIMRRYQEHCRGTTKCKYTRSFPPQRLAACWQVGDSLSHALQLEHKIKSLSRSNKLKLIKNPDCLPQFSDINAIPMGPASLKRISMHQSQELE